MDHVGSNIYEYSHAVIGTIEIYIMRDNTVYQLSTQVIFVRTFIMNDDNAEKSDENGKFRRVMTSAFVRLGKEL
jgi:hypothetical protein